jgi:hypothetical protein
MSLSREDFQPLNHQALIFIERTDIRSEKIFKWLPAPWPSRLPEPMVLGAIELPPELPRITWQRDKKPWGAAVAPTFFSITWRNFVSLSDEKLSLGTFISQSLPILLAFKKQFKTRVWRVACLSNRFAKHDQPAKFLAGHFCKPVWIKGPLNRPENFEIHSHKQFDLPESEKVNSWMRIKTSRLSEDAASADLVIVAEQDFNTPNEDVEREFKDSDISQFFKTSPKEIDKVLDLYLPPEKA